MKKITLLVLSIMFLFPAFGQGTADVEGQYVELSFNSDQSRITNLPKQKTAPKGSVYLFDDWKEATIILKDSSYVTDYPMKYNLRSRYLEFKGKDDSINVLFFAKVDLMFVNTVNGTSVYESCANYVMDFPELGDCEFVEVMAQGKVLLIDKLTLGMVEANYNTALDAGETSDTYYVEHSYYIIKNGNLIRISKSKGSIISALDDKKDQLKSFIKTNKLKMRQPENIAKVVKFYNSLYEESTN